MNIRTQDKRVFIYDQVNPPSFLVAEPTEDTTHEGCIGGNLSAIGINPKKQRAKGSTQKLHNIDFLQTYNEVDLRNLTST